VARRRRKSRSGRSQANPAQAIVFIVILLIAAGVWLMRDRQSPPVPPKAGVQSVRIATWNLRKFSERAAPDLVAIADIIRQADFHLLAIQEVQQEGQAVQRLRRQLNEPWRHVISPRTGNNERYAFLYRADVVEPLGEGQLLESAGVLNRAPFAMSFKAGQFDFTLVTVHLWYGDANFNQRRQLEVQALAGLAQRIAAGSSEKDLIVLGDFNEFRSGGNLHYFDNMGWSRLIAEPTNLGSTEVYDNLLINRGFTREYAGRSGVVRFDETRFANDDATARDLVSDHRPAWADFVVTGPDDD